MKRRLDVTPQARRDVAAILEWYRENVGAKAALKVAQTLRSRMVSLADGRVRGTEAVTASPYMRAVAKKHVIVFVAEEFAIKVVRVVHSAQDLEAIVAGLEENES